MRHGPRPPGGCASGPEAAAPPLDPVEMGKKSRSSDDLAPGTPSAYIWLSDLQRGRSASSSSLYLTLELRLRRLSSSRFLNWQAKGGNRFWKSIGLGFKDSQGGN